MPAPEGEEALDLGPEAGVEPPVHDRVGEGGGHGDGVAQAKDQVVQAVVVLKKEKGKQSNSPKKLNNSVGKCGKEK